MIARIFPRTPFHFTIRSVALAAALTAPTGISVAQTTFVWQSISPGNDASGTWAVGGWDPSGPPTGVGATVDFSAQDIMIASTVTLEGDFTVGNLVFGDTEPGSSASWTLGQGASGVLTLNNGVAAPVVTVNELGSGATATISAPLAGAGGLVKAGVGNLILTGANTYTGTTKILAGTLTATSASLNNTAVEFAGGTLRVNGNAATLSNALTVSADSGLVFGTGSNALTNTVSSSNGNAKLTISQGNGTANTVTFGVTASFSGYAGTVELANRFFRFDSGYNGAQSGAGALWQIDSGAQLSYRAGTNGLQTFQLGGLQGAGALSGGNAAGSGYVNYQVGARGGDTEFSGVISDGLTKTSFTKVGSGTLTLAGVSTYTGATAVNVGRLAVTGSLAASAVTVNGASAVLSGNGTVGDITLTAGGVQPGVNGVGTLNGASLTWNPAATLDFDLSAANGVSDQISVSGAFNLAAAGTFKFNFTGGEVGNTYTLVQFGGGQTNFSGVEFSANGIQGVFNLDVAAGKLTFTAVPEPQVWTLLGMGLVLVAGGRRFLRVRRS